MKKILPFLCALFVMYILPSESYAATGNLTWNLSNGLLTISGVNEMPIFDSSAKQPWADVREDITEVAFIGVENFVVPNMQYWFTDCINLTHAEIPYTAKIIGVDAFANCPNLTEVMFYYYDADEFEIAPSAFYSDEHVDTKVYLISEQTESMSRIKAHDWVACNRHVEFYDVYSLDKLAMTYIVANVEHCSTCACADIHWDDVAGKYYCTGNDHYTHICLDPAHDGSSNVCGICSRAVWKNGTGSSTSHESVQYIVADFNSTQHLVVGVCLDCGAQVSANWSDHTYYNNVCYSCNYGKPIVITWNNGGSTSTSTLLFGTTLTFPTEPTKTGYTFRGWFTEASGGTLVTTYNSVPSTDTTYYAQWEVSDVTITFISDGTAIQSTAQTPGATLTKPSNPTKTGYTFAGWSPALPTTVPSTATTYTAQWTPNTSYLYAHPNGGTYEGSTGTTIYSGTYGSTRSLGTPTRTGYTFTGWYHAAWNSSTSAFVETGTRYGTLSGSTFTYGPTAGAIDGALAQWTINTSTLTINPNGGTWGGTTSNTSKTQNYNTTLSVPNPTVTNYTATFTSNGGSSVSPVATNKTFAGWTKSGTFTAGTLSGTTFTFGSTKNGTGTLTANWNGSYAITLPTAPTKTGYTFQGWYNAASGGSKIGDANASITLSSNVTYYARWKANTYTITWDYGSGSYSSTQTYDATVTLPTSTPYKLNSHFDGWWTAATSGSAVSGTTYKTASNTTYYAHWIQVFSVTVPATLPLSIGADGNVLSTSVTVSNNSTGNVKISAVDVTAKNGWQLVPYTTDMSTIQVDAKRIGLKINELTTDSAVPFTPNWVIAADGTFTLDYDVVISATSVPYISEEVIQLIFVWEWSDTT